MALPVALFVAGALLAIWATERLLEGLVGIAALTPLSTFAAGAILSGFEGENVAVGIAAGVRDAHEVALGTVFGGAIFLVCVALGLGAIVAPLEVRLPRSFLLVIAAAPLLAGIGVVGEATSRPAGVLLLVAFALAMAYVIVRSRGARFLAREEVAEAQERRRSWPSVVALNLTGLAGLAVGGYLVADGATRIIGTFGLDALFVGMVLTPAAIEIEEVFRQAVPARKGHHEVSAANLLGTLLYFVLFNLGVIALVAPVRIDPLVRSLDWPFLVAVTWVAVLFLARGRVGRVEGALLLAAYAAYVALHALGR